MSKQLKVGDRVIFTHTNPDVFDPNDGAEAEVTAVIEGNWAFDGTAYRVEFHGGEAGIALKNELRLAEVVLVE